MKISCLITDFQETEFGAFKRTDTSRQAEGFWAFECSDVSELLVRAMFRSRGGLGIWEVSRLWKAAKHRRREKRGKIRVQKRFALPLFRPGEVSHGDTANTGRGRGFFQGAPMPHSLRRALRARRESPFPPHQPNIVQFFLNKMKLALKFSTMISVNNPLLPWSEEAYVGVCILNSLLTKAGVHARLTRDSLFALVVPVHLGGAA